MLVCFFISIAKANATKKIEHPNNALKASY